MGIGQRLKSIGLGIGGLIFGLVVIAIPVILLTGMTWISMKISPWLSPAFLLTLAVSIFVLGPLATIRKTRGFAALGYVIASWVFGAILWVWALLLTYEIWGMLAVIIGILLLGIGIVPIALVAAIFHAEWFFGLVMVLVATFGARFLAVWLASKVDQDEAVIVG